LAEATWLGAIGGSEMPVTRTRSDEDQFVAGIIRRSGWAGAASNRNSGVEQSWAIKAKIVARGLKAISAGNEQELR